MMILEILGWVGTAGPFGGVALNARKSVLCWHERVRMVELVPAS